MNQVENNKSELDQKIEYLRQVEVHLGNIPKSKDNWQSGHVEKFHVQTYVQSGMPLNDSVAEALFDDIVVSLHKQGVGSVAITQKINDRLNYDKGPNYCSEEEVISSLQQKGLHV